MVQKGMKILKNKPRVKNKHSPNILLYVLFDAEFYAEYEYICICKLIASLRWINGQKVNNNISNLA